MVLLVIPLCDKLHVQIQKKDDSEPFQQPGTHIQRFGRLLAQGNTKLYKI